MHISKSSNLALGSRVGKIAQIQNTNSCGGEGGGSASLNALTKEMQLEMIFRKRQGGSDHISLLFDGS